MKSLPAKIHHRHSVSNQPALISDIPEGEHEHEESQSPSVFPETDLDSRPRLLAGPVLKYPSSLLRLGVEGRVELSLIINEQGFIHELSVIASDHELFSAEAISQAQQMKFAPPQVDGEPVMSRIRWTVAFNLPE